MLACNLSGAVCVPLYDTLGPGAVSHAISHSGMALAFCQDAKAADLAAALAGLAEGRRRQAAGAAGAAADEPAGLALADGDGDGDGAGDGAGEEAAGAGHQVARVVVWGSGGRGEEGAGRAAEQLQAAAGGGGVRASSWAGFLLEGGSGSAVGDGAALLAEEPCPEDAATIMYTSGTTGERLGGLLDGRDAAHWCVAWAGDMPADPTSCCLHPRRRAQGRGHQPPRHGVRHCGAGAGAAGRAPAHRSALPACWLACYAAGLLAVALP
jgi:acyl-CoA synthetase (AMP-forming)/AMP-acid ligase II